MSEFGAPSGTAYPASTSLWREVEPFERFPDGCGFLNQGDFDDGGSEVCDVAD